MKMVSLWSKFKSSYEERKERKLFEDADKELQKLADIKSPSKNMVSLWSKFKISYEERKERKLFEDADKELQKLADYRFIKLLVLSHAENLLIQNLDDNEDEEDNKTDIDESEDDVSLLSKFKLSYKEGKELKAYVKEVEKLLENRMSHEDVKAYARMALNINPSTNLDENERVILQVVDIFTQALTDKEEDNKEDNSLFHGQELKEQHQDLQRNPDKKEGNESEENELENYSCFMTILGYMLSPL